MAIRVVIGDDHAAVRRGLARFASTTDIVIVAEAASGAETLSRTEQNLPDVLILDVRFADTDAIELVPKIRERLPRLPIVILTAYDNPTYVARLALLGINEYVLKSESRERILEAIHRAYLDRPPHPSGRLAWMRELMSRRQSEANSEFPLTQRELQVLRHVALGLSNREIGQSLAISIETVKEHVQNILRKIDATDRTQAAVRAVKAGIV